MLLIALNECLLAIVRTDYSLCSLWGEGSTSFFWTKIKIKKNKIKAKAKGWLTWPIYDLIVNLDSIIKPVYSKMFPGNH